jgi:hypothetical protein
MEKLKEYINETLDIYNQNLPINSVGFDNPNILLSNIIHYPYIKKPITYIPPEISKSCFIHLINNYASYIDFIKCDYICLLCAYFNMTTEFKMYYIPSKNNIYISTYYAAVNGNKDILEFIDQKNHFRKAFDCALLETDMMFDYSNLDLKDIVKYDLHRVIRDSFSDVGAVRLLATKYCAFRVFNQINRSEYLFIPKRPLTLKLVLFIREIIGFNEDLVINYMGDRTYTFNKDNIIVCEYLLVYMQMMNIKEVDIDKVDIKGELFDLGKMLIRKFIKTAYYDRVFIHSINFKIPFFNNIEHGG